MIYIPLSNNQLSGTIPPELGQMGADVEEGIDLYLDLSINQLSGSVPDSLLNLTAIPDADVYPSLFLEYNRLTVPTPYPPATPSALDAYLALKDPGWYTYQPVSAQITSGGGVLSARDGSVTVSVPAGGVAETITLVYTPLAVPTQGTGSLVFGGAGFDLSAFNGDIPLPDFPFLSPVTVSLVYSSAGVSAAVESTLRLYLWDASASPNAWIDAAGTCSPPASYIRNLAANTLSTQICHLSEFALLGKTALRVYMPVVKK